ncbi:MAG: NAD(P)H-dependent oxidoreductase subunit E [Nitrospirae bacterium]|nr:NAD(P)H-dependent oxidoreductase subunit E [Nitrospirota bacterium]
MLETLQRLLVNYKEQEGNIVTLLQETQAAFGYIPEEAVSFYSSELNLPASNFYGVATFYAQFYLKPRGKNIITACCGTACHVRGGDRIINNAKQELSLTGDDNTTKDGEFTLEQVACVGACSAAPVVLVNDKVFGKMTSEKLTKEIKAIKKADHE